MSLDQLMADGDGDAFSYEEEMAMLQEGLYDENAVPMEEDANSSELLLEEGELQDGNWRGGGECGAEVVDDPNLAGLEANAADLAQRKADAWRVAQAALEEANEMEAPLGEGKAEAMAENKQVLAERKSWAQRVLKEKRLLADDNANGGKMPPRQPPPQRRAKRKREKEEAWGGGGGAVVKKVCKELAEKNVDLVTALVEQFGDGAVLAVLDRTHETERNGGMFTQDGERRRTAGGVFMKLMTDEVGEELIKPIYAKNAKAKKQKAAKRAKLRETEALK